MAGNRIRALARQLSLTITDGGVAAGDPCRVGDLTGVALAAAVANVAVVDTAGSYSLSVKGLNDSGNSAVVAGDSLYYVDADTPKLSKKVSGYFFGTALAGVSSGASATIEVRLSPAPGNVGGANSAGTSTIGAGTISTADLADGAATTAKIADANVTTAKILAANVTGVKLAAGIVKVTLAAGTAGGADVTISGMSTADEICSVLSFTTAAAIASLADRTAEYAVGTGKATKAAGTTETNNQLVFIWILKH